MAPRIRAYRDADWDDWLRMSRALFPTESAGALAEGMRDFRSRFDAQVFVAERESGALAGFVEAGTRAYADGCDTWPVGFIEAWYVDPDLRGTGVGRALVAAAEAWARTRGYREMASDAELDNDDSHRAHRAIGYEEVGRVVQYRKWLVADANASADDQAAPDCVFCRILAGKLPGTFVYRDELCAAFMDIQPVNPGHVLVVPIRHAADLASVDALTVARMMQVAHVLDSAIRASGVRCEGVNLLLADGAAAMQEVFHAHLHVFPRYRGDGFGLRFGPDYANKPVRAALEETANQIRNALDARGAEGTASR